MNLKAQLRYFLDARGMTAAELARRAGVPKQSISGWLAGSNPRDVGQLKKVATVLSTTVDTLCFGTGSGTVEVSEAESVFDALAGDWVSGVFEVKIRRVKHGGLK